jgi:hypothetical protein
MKKTLLLIALNILMPVLVSAADKGREQETAPAVSEEFAHTLAISTLEADVRQLPGMRFDRELAPHPEGFYWFEVTAKVPNDASPLLGYFAVNKMTADVWDPVRCRMLTSVAIRRLQIQLRRKISISEFLQKKGKAPCQP